MPRLRRGRPAWAVPVLLFLAVVLAAALAFNVANLEAGDETAPPLPRGTSPGALFTLDPIYADVLVVGFGGTVVGAAIYLILTNRGHQGRPAKPSRWREILSSVLGLVIVLALLFGWPRMVHTLAPGNETADSTTVTGDSGNVTAWPASVGAPLGLFLAITVLGTILGMSYLLRRNAGGFEVDDDAAPDERRTASEAVGAAIAELEIGGDVRGAILACFQRFCRLLGSRGIAEQGAMTPRELERLAVDRLRVSPDASGTLTSLFEEARYSDHPLREADRARAIESLTGIRAALEA
ncbi:MAG TPA: DUF4129 domain-containing protein [Thermoplasmata archaeon]